MFTRKLGKFLRGDASPFQIYAGCVLAALIGFVPGFSQAPGLLIALIVLLVILNANLFLAGLVGIAAKLLGLLLTPVSFWLGRILLEGPTEGLFSAMANAPVLAFFGFEYYVVSGGLLLGLIFGVICGWFVVRSLKGMWRKLASLQAESAGYQKWSENRWVKISGFIFLGGTKGKKSWEELAARGMGNPVRIAGAVLVLVIGVAGFLGVRMLNDGFVTALIKSNLEEANGATVDLERASLEIGDGKLVLEGLGMADAGNLETNLFAAEKIEASIDTSDLLRKRAVVNTVIVTGASQGAARESKGSLVGPKPGPKKDESSEGMDLETLEDVFSNPDEWRDRLATLRRWLDKLSGAGEDEEESGPSWEEILRARVEALGYAAVTYDALIEGSPRLLVRKIEANGVKTASMPDQTLDVHAENLSTQPALVAEEPVVRVVSSSGNLNAELGLPSGSTSAARINFSATGFDVDEVAAQLKRDEPLPVTGGTLDISAQGTLSSVDSNLPIALTLRGSTVSIGGSGTRVGELTVPVAVRGPIDNPSIKVDSSAMQDALVSAGKKELTNRLGGEVSKFLGGGSEPKPDSGEAAEATGEAAEQESGDSLENAAGGLLQGLMKKDEPTP